MLRKKSKLIAYGLLLVAVILLIIVQPAFLDPLKLSVGRTVSRVIRIVWIPIFELKKILYYHRTFDEYVRLRKEVSTLQGRLIGMDELLIENSRLETLLSFKRKLIYASAAASVIGRDLSSWNASLLIDRGKADGIETGMPVVNALGVVGKIVEVGDHEAKVIMVSDPGFSVVALVKRSREVGLVSGTLQGLLRMRYLSANADIQIGDSIITSKLSSTFPEDLMIGEVVAVHASERSPTIDCIIQPAVPLSQIEEVLVIQK